MIKYLRLEYLFVFVALFWIPLQRYILKFDGAGNTVALLAIFVLITLSVQKIFYKTAFKKPLIIWFIWVVYAFFNTMLHGYKSELPAYSFLLNISIPFVLMLIIALMYKVNPKKIINVIISALYFGLILILVFDQNTDQGRIGSEINSNTIGTMGTITCMLLYINYFKKYMNIKMLAVLAVIPVYAIISTGSRTAFGGLAFLIALHFFINRSKYLVVTVFKMLIAVIIMLLPFNYILDNTSLGERILSTTEQSQGMKFETGNAVLDMFGDRGFFYYQGWEVFKDQPLTGVGLEQFKYYNQLELDQHSEYMIQLTELGLIGFVLFFAFYYLLFKHLKFLNKIRYFKREPELFMGLIIIILLMITATRMYRIWYYFTIVGLAIGYINQSIFLLEKNNKEMLSAKKNI